MTRRLATQRLAAGSDTNGNPRRLIAVYDLGAAGDMVALYDEGYAGYRSALADMTDTERAHRVELPEWTITPYEYRSSLADARRKGIAHG